MAARKPISTPTKPTKASPKAASTTKPTPKATKAPAAKAEPRKVVRRPRVTAPRPEDSFSGSDPKRPTLLYDEVDALSHLKDPEPEDDAYGRALAALLLQVDDQLDDHDAAEFRQQSRDYNSDPDRLPFNGHLIGLSQREGVDYLPRAARRKIYNLHHKIALLHRKIQKDIVAAGGPMPIVGLVVTTGQIDPRWQLTEAEVASIEAGEVITVGVDDGFQVNAAAMGVEQARDFVDQLEVVVATAERRVAKALAKEAQK